MSLTSLLASASPVRDFFAEAFPNTRPIVSEVNDVLDAASLLENPALFPQCRTVSARSAKAQGKYIGGPKKRPGSKRGESNGQTYTA